MSRRTPADFDDRWHTYPDEDDGTRVRSGPGIGPLRITATRIFLLLALVGSLGYLAYALIVVRDTSAIPMLISGAFVLGIVFIFLGIAGAVGMSRAGRERRDRDAMLLALGGGIAIVIGLFCFAGGAILALVLRG